MKKNGVNRTAIATTRVVNVVRINPYKCSALVPQILSGSSCKKWMILIVALGSPVLTPAGVYQHRLIADIDILESISIHSDTFAMICVYEHARQVYEAPQMGFAEILAVGIAVERAVNIRACIGHHVDSTDEKLGPFLVMLTRVLAAEVITDYRARYAFVADQAIVNRVTEIDQFRHS